MYRRGNGYSAPINNAREDQALTVRVDKDGPVTTFMNDRTEARNAVDPKHGDALVEAFLAFDRDEDA